LQHADVVVLGLDMRKYDSKLAQMVNGVFLMKRRNVLHTHSPFDTFQQEKLDSWTPQPMYLLLEANNLQLKALAREQDTYISTSRLLRDFWTRSHVEPYILYDLTVLSSFQSDDLIHIFDLDMPAELESRDVRALIQFLRLDGEPWKSIPIEINGTVAFQMALESGQVLYDTLERQKLALSEGTHGSKPIAPSPPQSSLNAYILHTIPKKNAEETMWNEIKNLIRDFEPLVSKNMGGESLDLLGYLVMDRSHPHYIDTLTNTYWFAKRYLVNELEIGAEILRTLAHALALCEVVPPSLVVQYIETEVNEHVRRIESVARTRRPAVSRYSTNASNEEEPPKSAVQTLKEGLSSTAPHLAFSSIRSTKYNVAQSEKISLQFQMVYSKWKDNLESILQMEREPKETLKVQSFITHLLEVQHFGQRETCNIFLVVLPHASDAIINHFVDTLKGHQLTALCVENIHSAPEAQDLLLLCSQQYYEEILLDSSLENTFTCIYFLYTSLLDCMQNYFETFRHHATSTRSASKTVRVAARYQYTIDRLTLLESQKVKISDTIVQKRTLMFTRKRKVPVPSTSFDESVLRPQKRRKLDSSPEQYTTQPGGLVPVKMENTQTQSPAWKASAPAKPPQQKHQPQSQEMELTPQYIREYNTEKMRFPYVYNNEAFQDCQALSQENPISLFMLSIQNTYKKGGGFDFEVDKDASRREKSKIFRCSYTFTNDCVLFKSVGLGKSKKEAKQNSVLNFMRLAVRLGKEQDFLNKFPSIQHVRHFVEKLGG